MITFAEKEEVTFSKCVDGDTAKVILNEEEITVRFLAIDTPETKHPTKGEEPFGKEASEYTCSALTNATTIELEYDDGSDKQDKYSRYLAWIWVDGELLQDNLIKEGLAEVAYLYGDYKYTSLLQDHEAVAKTNKKGKWEDENASDNVSTQETEDSNEEDASQTESLSLNEKYVTIITIIIFVLLMIFVPKYRKKNIKKVKRKIKKNVTNEFEKNLKKILK